MATDCDEVPSVSTPELLREILQDVRLLFDQQLQLTQKEIEADANVFTSAAMTMASGTAALAMAALIICLASANLLHWLTSPLGTDPATVPLWECQIFVAMALAIGGTAMILVGRAKLKSLAPGQMCYHDSAQRDES